MKEYLKNYTEVIEENKSSLDGLDSSFAKARLERDGKNKLAEGKKTSLIKRFLSQLADPMIIILIAAAVVSAVTAAFGGEGEGYADVIIIMFVVIINAVLGVYQESKAEKAIEALQEIAAATSKVIRDGKLIEIRSEDLVIGDIVVLEAGDSVPADCRIIECASLKIEESALTGESVPVEKQVEAIDPLGSDDVPLGDRKNMCYMGSAVVYGRGKAIVVATGMDTEMGKIADALTQAKDEETPLQIKLNQLSKILSIIVLGICVFIFAFDIVRSLIVGDAITLSSTLEFFMVAVSLAVAAIPEGLAAVVTIVLSIGVTKMSKRNAVIRKLTAVETLGCTQIICSDKTGTLTQNKMTVVEYKGTDEKLLATAMALCCDAELQEDGVVKGEPTEAALVAYANKLGLKKYELETNFPRVGEAPFDSMRKMMTTIHKTDNGYVQYTKGAPDVVLSKCTTAYVEGKRVPMTDEIRTAIMEQNKSMADEALRVLCALVTSSLSGYAFARLNFKGKNFMFGIVLFQMMIPTQVFIIPQYIMVSKLHLTNTVAGLVFPGLISAFGTFLLKQAYMGLPKDLEDAARLDGCNIPQTFLFVMAPLAKSSMVALGIFTAVFAYKDLMWPMIVCPDSNKTTLASALAKMNGQYAQKYPELMMAALISCVPMIIIYIFFQKQFIEGIATSGGKL